MNTQPFNKQPNEIERIGVSYKHRLVSGDSVSSATYVITDPDDVDVTATMKVTSSEQITDEDGDSVNESASIKVQLGTSGLTYKLTIVATTANGCALEEDRNIIVAEV